MTALGSWLYSMLAIVGPVIGALGLLSAVLIRREVLLLSSVWLARVWTLGVLLAWILRTCNAGHLPLFGTYESALSLAMLTSAIAVAWEIRKRRNVRVSPLAVFVAALIMLHGRGFDPTAYALTISEKSWVVDVHAFVAWAAFAVLVVNVVLAFYISFGGKGPEAEAGTWLLSSLRLGFFLHTGLLVSGSIYKFLLFGSAWSFDPIETLGLVVWLAYGTLLHLHLLADWNARRLSKWCLGVFVLLVISFRAIVYFPPWATYHIFDMDRRIHVGAEELGIGGGS